MGCVGPTSNQLNHYFLETPQMRLAHSAGQEPPWELSGCISVGAALHPESLGDTGGWATCGFRWGSGMGPVFLSHCCLGKSPRTCWLKPHNYDLTVLEVRITSR